MNVMKNLCVKLTDKGREKIKEERKRKFGSQMTASEEFGIPQVNISRWERSVNPMFYLFKSYLQKLGLKGFLKNKEYVIGTKYHGFEIKKIKSNKLSLEKAYVLGVIGPGDGYIGGNYLIGLNAIDKDFVDYFQNCLEKTFGLKCGRYIKKSNMTEKGNIRKKQYSVILCSKSAVESFKKYKVSFKEKLWKIPKIIKNSNDSYKAMYLKGIFDSQGTVSNCSKFTKIKIENKEGIKEIQNLLKDLNIDSSIPKSKVELMISSKKNLDLYNSKIGFVIERKKERIKGLLNSYKQKQSLHSDVIKVLPKMIELRKEGLSYRKIASTIGVCDRNTVRNNLQREGY